MSAKWLGRLAYAVINCGKSEEWFWMQTERQFYAIMIGDNANNGTRVEYDDPGLCFEEE